MQRRRNARGAPNQDDGTARKMTRKPSEKESEEKGTEQKLKKTGVFRKLGFILHPDKNDLGSTVKKRKEKKKQGGTQRARKPAPIWNPDKKVHFNIEKAHSTIPLKGDAKFEITEVQKKVFVKFATEAVKRSPPELSAEFMGKIKVYVGQPMERKIFDANPTKNRYKDVVCNDITRVILNDGNEGDYIHANYVNGLNAPFILTQGPTATTVIDFWRMIVHTKTSYIVMLCDVMEEGKKKCEQYYPDKVNDTVTFGMWTITCTTEDEKDANITKRTLSVKNTESGKEHNLKHLHTKSWPDKSVPNSPYCLLRMLYIVRTAPGPVTVHCSAGIGRTGTFVAVEACLQILTDGKELDLMAAVKALRNSRAGSVQVDIQYMTLLQILLNYGKDNGYWDDSDLDDRVELLTWNIQQYIQSRGKVDHVLAAPSTPQMPQQAPPPPVHHPTTPAKSEPPPCVPTPKEPEKKLSKKEKKCQHQVPKELLIPKEPAKEVSKETGTQTAAIGPPPVSPVPVQATPSTTACTVQCCTETTASPGLPTPVGPNKDSTDEEVEPTQRVELKEPPVNKEEDGMATVIPLPPPPPAIPAVSSYSVITTMTSTPSPPPPPSQPATPVPMRKSLEKQAEQSKIQPVMAKKSAEKDKNSKEEKMMKQNALRKNRSEYFM